MKRRAVLCLIVLLAHAAPAAAWDPYWEQWAPPPPPAPAVPPGIYYVTEVYVGDTVTVSGPVTTYGTATIADTPGTYARVADTVSTGAPSIFDGTSFNGRASLEDGRPVAGTYYENFVLSNGSFVPVSVVFFQNDAEIDAGPLPAPIAAPVPVPEPGAAPAPARIPVGVAPVAVIAEPIAPPRRDPVLHPGVATWPLGDVAFSLEVLRGRPITVWFRAVADGATVQVSSWRVVSGEHIALGPTSGGQDDPLRARWDVVTRPGGSWILRVEVTVLLDGMTYAAAGDVAVVVRSPALIR